MGAERGRFAWGVWILSVLGLGCAALIVLGEAFGGPGGRVVLLGMSIPRSWFWSMGGAALGMIFIIYGLTLLLLRKMGIVGPRRAER